MKRIAFDIWGITYGYGIGKCTKLICEHLINLYPENDYILLNWSNDCIPRLNVGGNKYIELCVGSAVRSDNIESIINNFISKYKIDVYIDFSPLWGNKPQIKKEWMKDTVLCGIIYDLIHYAMKNEFAHVSKNLYENYIEDMYNVKNYDLLFAISENTRKDAIEYIGLPENKIFTASIAAYIGNNGEKADKGILKKLNIKKENYFLFPSSEEMQKNLLRTVIAYAKACEQCDNIPPMVVTGKYTIELRKKWERILYSRGLEKKLILPGYISNEELLGLLKNAKWVVFPSLYEGFGMPILEAWEQGVPVLTSNRSATREVGGDAVFFVNPEEIESIVEGYISISSMDWGERYSYIEAGKQRLTQFSWTSTVEVIMKEIDGYEKSETIDEKESCEWLKKRKEELEEIIESKKRKKRSIDEELKVNIAYSNLLDRWMALKERNRSLADYYSDKKINNIAIYGFGIIADHIIFETIKSGVSIKYGIDRNAKYIIEEFPVFTDGESSYPLVDAIIVSPVWDYENIKKKLKACYQGAIVNIDEIIHYLENC